MHILDIVYNSGATRVILCKNAEAAQAAYKAVSEAMANFKAFSNDKDKAIEVSDGTSMHTFRLDHLTAISIADTDENVAEQLEWSRYIKRIKEATEVSDHQS